MGKPTNHQKKSLQNEKKKYGSSPEQDLHPDWDLFRGTMLYPPSCWELAINGEQIIILYVTSGLRTASIKCVKTLRKSVTNPR